MPRKLCLLLAASRFVTFKMHENFYLKINLKKQPTSVAKARWSMIEVIDTSIV